MSEQVVEKNIENQIEPANLNLFFRATFTLLAAFGSYLLVGTHYLFCVRVAHLLGDVTYIPPSILRFTGVIFRDAEVSAFAQILFFVIWLILVAVSCCLLFAVASLALDFVLNLILSDAELESAINDCLAKGFVCVAPVIALSLLTLLIMPLESTHLASESTSLTQIGALMPFAEFLYAMTEATIVIFLVCLFVVITVVVAYLLSYFWDSDFSFIVWMFVGVCVGIGVIMVLGHYLQKALEFIQFQTGNSYLTFYAIFAVYAFVCTILILPSALKKETKKERIEKLKESVEAKKKRKRSKNSANQTELQIEN